MGTLALRLTKVTKRYGRQVVLNELDMDIERGEQLAVLGPSGSGKSTLLRVLAGLENPTVGGWNIPTLARRVRRPRAPCSSSRSCSPGRPSARTSGWAAVTEPDIRQLAGRKVAIPFWWSIHNVMMQQLLRAAGLRPVIRTQLATSVSAHL
jgi:energy-coupling factor transporter ATP-binding protein EcfA2